MLGHDPKMLGHDSQRNFSNGGPLHSFIAIIADWRCTFSSLSATPRLQHPQTLLQ